LKITTWHIDDQIDLPNVHNLTQEQLLERKVVYIDIAETLSDLKDYQLELDPTLFSSVKTGRGPLLDGWTKTTKPLMCCYKLVEVNFPVLGLQSKTENLVNNVSHDDGSIIVGEGSCIFI
jgi:hypothetical protein